MNTLCLFFDAIAWSDKYRITTLEFCNGRKVIPRLLLFITLCFPRIPREILPALAIYYKMDAWNRQAITIASWQEFGNQTKNHIFVRLFWMRYVRTKQWKLRFQKAVARVQFIKKNEFHVLQKLHHFLNSCIILRSLT